MNVSFAYTPGECIVMKRTSNNYFICVFPDSVKSLIDRGFAYLAENPEDYKPYCLELSVYSYNLLCFETKEERDWRICFDLKVECRYFDFGEVVPAGNTKCAFTTSGNDVCRTIIDHQKESLPWYFDKEKYGVQ